MNGVRQQNTTNHPIQFLMVRADDGESPFDGAEPVVSISKDGGAFVPAAGAVVGIGNGVFSLAGNVDDRNTIGELWVHIVATDAKVRDIVFLIVPYDPFSVSTFQGNVPLAELTANAGANPTAEQVLMRLYMQKANNYTETASQQTVQNSTGAVIIDKTIHDDGTTLTVGKDV